MIMNGFTSDKASGIDFKVDGGPNEEIAAAIALALECYNNEEHDCESFMLTIKPTQSAWNSRYATLRRLPERK